MNDPFQTIPSNRLIHAIQDEPISTDPDAYEYQVDAEDGVEARIEDGLEYLTYIT